MPYVVLTGGTSGVTTMSDLIATFGTFVTSLVTWMTSFLGFVTSNPILLIFVFLVVAKIVVGIVRRWLPGRA